MSTNLTPGLSASLTWDVTDELTAIKCKSGSLPVFGTPALAAIMEAAACKAIESALPDGSTSVGTYIAIEHSAASPVGEAVTAEARLEVVDGRKLEFIITASDKRGKVGEAAHKRVVVDSDRFMSKLT